MRCQSLRGGDSEDEETEEEPEETKNANTLDNAVRNVFLLSGSVLTILAIVATVASKRKRM